MSENACTFCKIAVGYESGIVYEEEEGVIAFKYTNGRGLVLQRPPAGAGGSSTCTRTRGESVGMGIQWA